jgi:opacity protein-like surface antigen
MHKKKTLSSASLALAVLLSSTSQAQESEQAATPTAQFAVGAKVWNASWLSYIPATYAGAGANGQPAIGDIANSAEGSRRTSVLPQLAVRYGKFLASASYGHFKSDFSLLSSPIITPSGTLISTRTDYFSRRESDVSLGYFVLPQIALTLGYKYAKELRDTSAGVAPQRRPLVENKASSVLLGAFASFPIQGALNFYAQAGYGPARLKTRGGDSVVGTIDAHGRYLIGELGLTYPVLLDRAGLRAVSAAIGYRTQTVKTSSSGLVYGEDRDLRDVRDGLVLSLNVSL